MGIAKVRLELRTTNSSQGCTMRAALKRALGGQGDWIPTGCRLPRRLAALAAWCIACVSAAATTIALTWEIVPIDVLAANIILAHADVAATPVARGALELVAIAVPTHHRRLSALTGCADGVPCAPRSFRLTALAAWRIACVTAASTTVPLTWKAVPLDVLAADIMLAHTGTATTTVSTSAFEPGPVIILALHRRLATSRGGILRSAKRQERVFFAATLPGNRALLLPPRDSRADHEESKSHNGSVRHFFKCPGCRTSLSFTTEA